MQDSIRINYGDGNTFDTLHDQTDESRDQSEQKENNPELKEVGNDLTGKDERADNHFLSNKLPPDVEFTYIKGDLEQQEYLNNLDL